MSPHFKHHVFRKSHSPRIDCVTLGSHSLFIFFSPALPCIHIYPSLWFVGFAGNNTCSTIYVTSPLSCIFYICHWVSSVGGEKESLPDCCETLVLWFTIPIWPFLWRVLSDSPLKSAAMSRLLCRSEKLEGHMVAATGCTPHSGGLWRVPVLIGSSEDVDQGSAPQPHSCLSLWTKPS